METQSPLGTSEHPFLICRKAEYDLLRERASRAPWSDMAAEAGRVLEARRDDSTRRASRGGTGIRDVMGSAALLYVIDPDRRDVYRERIREILDAWPVFLEEVDARWNAGGNRWFATVPPSSGYFNSVLALDVIHDDLPDADLGRYEQGLEAAANWFWAEMRGWGMATFGPRAVWAAYKHEARLPEAMAQYREAVFQQMTEDGVGRNGPEYSHARLNGERTAKYGFMHVAEYTGLSRNSVYRSHKRALGRLKQLGATYRNDGQLGERVKQAMRSRPDAAVERSLTARIEKTMRSR